MNPSLPRELEDDAQAAVLYSPFRDKALNPTSWKRKMIFWQNFLTTSALERGEISFSATTLPKQYERKGITPKCFQAVLEEMERCGTIRSMADFNKDQGWVSWGFSMLVKQPLSWGVGRLLGSPKKSSDAFIWPHVLQKSCEKTIDLLQSKVGLGLADSLMTLSEVQEMCSEFITQEQDFKLVMAQLEKEKKIALREMDDSILIKYIKKNESSVTPIKDQEIDVYRIIRTKTLLETEVDSLSASVDRLLLEARAFIHEGKKSKAMLCLRQKKRALKSLDRKSSSIVMLEDIIQKIEDASTNELVVKACEAGVAALKSLNAQMPVEKVEAVMDDVHEALADQNDITEALSSGVPGQSEEFDEEVERELQDLLAEDVTEEKQTLDADNELADQLSSITLDEMGLPNVPQHSPSKSFPEGKTVDELKRRLAELAS